MHYLFLKRVWLVGIKSLLSVPNADCLAFSDPTQVLKRYIRALIVAGELVDTTMLFDTFRLYFFNTFLSSLP